MAGAAGSRNRTRRKSTCLHPHRLIGERIVEISKGHPVTVFVRQVKFLTTDQLPVASKISIIEPDRALGLWAVMRINLIDHTCIRLHRAEPMQEAFRHKQLGIVFI